MDEHQKDIARSIEYIVNYDVPAHYLKELFPHEAWQQVMKAIFHYFKPSAEEIINGLELCKVLEVLGYSSKDGGLNFSIGAHLLASAIPFSLYANENLRNKYLDGLFSGELICANAITEAEAGSDIFSMSSKAELSPPNYRLNGTKTFISNIKEANLVMVYLITDNVKKAYGGVSLFLLDKKQFTVGQSYSKMGIRTCSIGELILNNVSVNKQQIIGKAGGGSVIFNTAMTWEKIGLSAIHLGTMQRLFEKSVAYVKLRKQGGMAIAKYQAVAHKIAEMKTILHTSRLLVYDSAKKLNSKSNNSEYSAICKLQISESYIKIAELAMEVHGGNGYMEEYDIERSLRDAYASKIYSGTNDIQKNIIAKWNGL